MSIGLIIALVAVLFVLIIGYNIMLQYKTRIETMKKQEASRFLAIIDATEDLIGNAHHLPFSLDLLVCLNQRILDALESMLELDPKNRQLAQRVENMKMQIQQLKESYTGGESTTFKVPSSDKQAIIMLKLVKRLRDTIRSEHNKGRFNTQAYVTENARLETIQIRINIENVIKRANEAVVRNQVGTARQLLKKGIDVLSSKNDAYSIQAKDKLTSMLGELDQNKKDQNAEELLAMEEKERSSDMEALFGAKKKW
ncbi:DNA repair protein [Vibrio sp. HA2012]|uniref:DNA repair protein n=1 Tax=Vibrio sp. HA2012 TaxID=1971595 RepID=UPI000C2B8E2D|nr:DNA repair protein [Vibrio sp. HA2012]PJC87636.1 DNA repair protein [Vibrio sp. HA2012]